ncbi:MAG: glycosyltransferase family 2 protein [Chloroflexi bacterium]|nr:glycosyltransferase family 2 protein [Chloroflexota bacterium]
MARILFLTQTLPYPLGVGSPAVLPYLVPLADVILSFLQIIVAAGLAYYYLLLIASLPRRQTTRSHLLPQKSFAIAIPAHNEAAVLAETIRLLKAQNYPTHLFDIYVLADHCDDDTAQVARSNGAMCYERNEEPRGRKAYALQWLLKRILAAGRDHDALVIFDADSRVDASFLPAMNCALGQGRLVLQGKHVIASPQESRFSGLAAVDMRLNNLLRNQARQNLGFSCRLMGDAMCFATEVIRRHGWPAESLGEDREYGLYLLTQGIRVGYVPEALSFGQAAPGWREASTQRLRWYGGMLQIQKSFALPLLRLGLRNRDGAALDQAVELLLPPLSVLALLSVCVAGIQGMWPSLHLLFPLPVSMGFVLAWVLFPLLGLWIDGTPASAYRALLYGPFYLLWRLWLGFWARLRGERVRWVRTRRREEVRPSTPDVNP